MNERVSPKNKPKAYGQGNGFLKDKTIMAPQGLGLLSFAGFFCRYAIFSHLRDSRLSLCLNSWNVEGRKVMRLFPNPGIFDGEDKGMNDPSISSRSSARLLA